MSRVVVDANDCIPSVTIMPSRYTNLVDLVRVMNATAACYQTRISPDRVPMSFIRDLRELGVRVEDCGLQFGAIDHIRSNSPQYKTLLDMLAELDNVKVEVWLGFTSQEVLYCHPGELRPTFISNELGEQLLKMIPDDPKWQRGIACGEARWLVESVVRMVEDPPEACTDARSVPEGQYIISVEMHFANLLCYVSVFRRSSLSPTVTESLGA